ncbi:N-formylglutamate amidohydrolase [Brevirhabdus pacifica]|uniref:N-formylglutamate amidohydrolase n=1 Tax=Brevirhabdus pacifica TaxID=1267768 RepID=A0A1U7DI50_9RHOB|nr:N-formylglutamate amidohydrolase [Brevirhabdus pacifica]APX89666.1 N-formylglutamate amidohydrolase [Brevirhabdus pacifica]OWU74512.1 N-formylglutamate amidohydrolase [Loktanella sp. 22II-4b]PJJ85655.1 N-formylglutamate amidohydrolase [Brevirhabdus pacifica]
MAQRPYTLRMPDTRSTSVVFASPHSGRNYARTFLSASVLDEQSIRSSEDAFVDLLFEEAPLTGAPLLVADTPRAFIDLNRSSEELDPALVEGVRHSQMNPRISSGLGVVPRVVANGRAIYRGKMTLAEAQRRIDRHWRPYHDTLQALLDEAHALFDEAILVDLHSMPHEAVQTVTGSMGRRPDVVLGDRFGSACSGAIVDMLEEAFVNAGLVVARNAPFAGAYITQRYGRPSRKQHAVQVEIDRALYMDEREICPNEGFDAFKALMSRALYDIAEIGRPALPLAAE